MKAQKTELCDTMIEAIPAYLEGVLDEEQVAEFESHVRACGFCSAELKEHKQALQLVAQAYSNKKISPDFDQVADEKLASKRATGEQDGDLVAAEAQNEDAPFLPAREKEPSPLMQFLAGAPWWGVSVALHVLVILLASLVSMTMNLPKGDDAVVMLTQMEQAPTVQAEQEKPKNDTKSALESTHDTPPTDPTSQTESDIVVPPDILAKAEIGDHFETINLDRPDTHSAFGNPDSHFFYSVKGNDEPEGGGGQGGIGGLDDVIGIGGPASKGTGGGWGGGNGTGIGVGNGSGRGSFGNRNGGGRRLMVMRHCGSKATESAVDRALEWLARHQEPDGHWDCVKNEGTAADIYGDAPMTGFALLCFLGAGHTVHVGKYKDNVSRGVNWLIKKLEDCDKNHEGRWHTNNYTQGISALAMAEACGMCPRDADIRKAAQKAIDGVIAGQMGSGTSESQGWDYGPKGTTNDTCATGWNIMALKSAKIAGLHVDPFGFQGALTWINAGQDLNGAPASGADYWEGGRMSYRGTLADPKKGQGSLAMMGAAALVRLMVGGERCDAPGIAGPCNIMKKNLFTADGDYYYFYYATFTMFQKGGDHWKAWNEPMKKILPDCQRKDGDMAGSWDPHGHVQAGGRVMSTSLGCLCLEVYYRYAKINN